MAPIGIPMSPVNDTALSIPFVFAGEGDRIAFLQGTESGSEINIVGNQQGLAGFEPENELLMPATCYIIGQQGLHPALSFDLQIAAPIGKGPCHDGVGIALLNDGLRLIDGRPLIRDIDRIAGKKGQENNQGFFHGNLPERLCWQAEIKPVHQIGYGLEIS